ncbi:MAG: 50S ribosomal protein L25 [Phycisphaerae bacterium]|nr:50S ribosomal protein L25 [Phycisphaerae bacterium]
MEVVHLTARRRENLGTRPSRALREEGLLPAVIYGHNQPPEYVVLNRHDVEVALHHGARTLDLKVDGKAQQYLIKEVQHNHLDSEVIHVDLMRVDVHERVRVNVGVEPRGTPKGVSEGGIFDPVLASIEVECRVTEIPDVLHPLVTNLGLGQSLLVKDLELPPGVKAITDPDAIVAIVRAKGVEEEEVAEEGEAEGETSAEPERITRAKKEEEED